MFVKNKFLRNSFEENFYFPIFLQIKVKSPKEKITSYKYYYPMPSSIMVMFTIKAENFDTSNGTFTLEKITLSLSNMSAIAQAEPALLLGQ
jgi:hypothetical protein